MRFRYPWIYPFLIFFLFSSFGFAKPFPLEGQSFTAVKEKFAFDLSNHLNPSSPSINRLQLVSQHTDKNHVSHVRMQQYYQDFPVYGGYIITHSKLPLQNLLHAQKTVTMNGVVHLNLQKELGAPSPTFVNAGKQALVEFTQSLQTTRLRDAKVWPVVYIDEEANAFWAYHVTVFVEDDVPQRPSAILDAKTFLPFITWNDLKTRRGPVSGIGYGGNKKTGKLEYGKSAPLLELTRDLHKDICYLENSLVKVIDMKSQRRDIKKIMQFPCKNNADLSITTGYLGDGYDQINGAYSPSNDALYAGNVIQSMYKDWYGLDALTKNDGQPMAMIMRVHYGLFYGNAFWDGAEMTFGDGDSLFYPLVSLGIAAHEISHGFTEQHSGLVYYGQAGGMNESFSDMAAQAAEFYSTGHNHWRIGDEIIKPGKSLDALRYMDIPSRDGSSIDNVSQFKENMDPHYSSGVFNRLFYLLANTPGWDTHSAFDVMVKANVDYWIPIRGNKLSFQQGGCEILQAARDEGKSVNDVSLALEEVGINVAQCVVISAF
jgi:pseudolysin